MGIADHRRAVAEGSERLPAAFGRNPARDECCSNEKWGTKLNATVLDLMTYINYNGDKIYVPYGTKSDL